MARFNKGWVKAWRDMVDGDLPQNIWLWGIWNWLLLAATWKPTKILWKGKQREIPPGTVVMGLGELAAKWECSKNTIKKWLKYLEESERITLEMCTRGTIVTIRNWDVYQAQDVEDCTPTEHEVNTDCTRAAHEVHLSKESKKERKKESKKLNAGIRIEYPQEFDQLWKLQTDTENDQANGKQIEANSTKSNQTQPSGSGFVSNINTLSSKKDTTLLWNYYREELKKLRDLDSVKSGVKENTLCKKLIAEFGLEKSQDLVLVFLQDSDSFVADSAYQFGLLYSQRQKYLARLARSSPSSEFVFPDSTAEVSHA